MHNSLGLATLAAAALAAAGPNISGPDKRDKRSRPTRTAKAAATTYTTEPRRENFCSRQTYRAALRDWKSKNENA